MEWLYFILLGGSVLFPLVWSFENRVTYYKKWKSLFPAIILTGIFFLIWDEIFTQNGYWGFNEKYITGIKIGSLPLEEILFFIIIPFSCVFIYECVGYFLPGNQRYKYSDKAALILGVVLIIISLFNFSKAYTFWNFLFTGILLVYIGIRNPDWLSKFWIAYLYHLIPFFLVNGVLTGSFIDEQVVWYNNEENFGVRVFTVPIEDSMYSLLLLLMNINYYEFFKNKLSK
ncbi:MAG: lycopene cyclase domain-containing protein [Cyclobacteriaceae bacterium]